MKTRRLAGGLFCSGMAALLSAGATLPADGWVAPDAVPQLWPPPPAAARISTEGRFASPADLGIQPTWFDRLANVFTGGNRGTEKLVKPCGVAVDEAGNLCVTDTGTNVVWFFDRGRRRYTRWEQIDKVRFVLPVAVAKADGIIYVADSGLSQVVAFTENGRLRFRLHGAFTRPAGLALAGGKLYVADSGAHCVLIFDRQGQPQGRFGARGVAPGTFNFPTHIAADAQGRLYVTDAMNSRVQVFDAAGQVLGSLGSLGDGSGHFSRPKGVAVDRLGHVYVADALFDNIQVFNPDGQFLLDLGSSGSAAGEFWMPAGMAISRDNRIFVADSYNGRVQVLRYIGQP